MTGIRPAKNCESPRCGPIHRNGNPGEAASPLSISGRRVRFRLCIHLMVEIPLAFIGEFVRSFPLKRQGSRVGETSKLEFFRGTLDVLILKAVVWAVDNALIQNRFVGKVRIGNEKRA